MNTQELQSYFDKTMRSNYSFVSKSFFLMEKQTSMLPKVASSFDEIANTLKEKGFDGEIDIFITDSFNHTPINQAHYTFREFFIRVHSEAQNLFLEMKKYAKKFCKEQSELGFDYSEDISFFDVYYRPEVTLSL